MANVPNSFRDFFQWGVRMKLCLSIFGTLAIHYGKGQLIPKDFQISQQNIASLGNNSEQEKCWDRLWGAGPTPAFPGQGNFSAPWTAGRWSWVREKSRSQFSQKVFKNLVFGPISCWFFAEHEVHSFGSKLSSSSGGSVTSEVPPKPPFPNEAPSLTPLLLFAGRRIPGNTIKV